MADSLGIQIMHQGFEFNMDEIEQLQKDVDAMNRLRIRGYIPDGQIGKLNQKIFNRIQSHVQKMNTVQP